jgi:hypothetical protein
MKPVDHEGSFNVHYRWCVSACDEAQGQKRASGKCARSVPTSRHLASNTTVTASAFLRTYLVCMVRFV